MVMWKAVMFSSCDLLFIILFRKPNLNHQFVLLRVEKSLKRKPQKWYRLCRVIWLCDILFYRSHRQDIDCVKVSASCALETDRTFE